LSFEGETMPSTTTNPFVYVFPALALAAVVLYFLYGALDRLGLETQRSEARVTGKQFSRGSTTYHTNVVAGRSWTQSSQNPDAYIVSLEIDGKATIGAVSPEMYQSLQPDDRVRVEFKQTRFSNRTLVTDVRR
jgi:hypothetical protein